MSNPSTAILIIDGDNIVCRAGAIVGEEAFIEKTGDSMNLTMLDNMIAKRIREMKANEGYTHVIPIATFDAGHHNMPTINDAMYDRWQLLQDYKANRRDDHSDPVKTQALAERSKWKHRWADSLLTNGTAVCQHPGVEADDIMTYIAQELAGKTDSNVTTAIWTMDKDLMQNVSDDEDNRIIMYRKRPRVGETIVNEAEVIKEKGVPASKIHAQLTLQGDGADGYKAISMYGGKRGLNVINQSDGSYDSLLNTLMQDEKVRLKNKLAKGEVNWNEFWSQTEAQLNQNWKLAGCGRDYMSTSAVSAADLAVKHVLNQL